MAEFNRGREREAAAVHRKAIPHAAPNRSMVRIADALSGCDGKLIKALQTIEAPTDYYEEPLPLSSRL
jgi:predicted protein tyrosine phosphatase